MDQNFWLKKWQTNDIGFHASEANRALVEYFRLLDLAEDSRVFVPLCGKTLDIRWLLSRGYRVAGAELIETAIEQLLTELGVIPDIAQAGALKRYSAPNIDIFVGNIFELSKDTLGAVDAVYDRAAMVALPENVRPKYTAHLMEITGRAPQLLLSFEYDQSAMEGPPFSVSNDEVKNHYHGHYDMTLKESTPIPGGMKGKIPAKENVWLLRDRT